MGSVYEEITRLETAKADIETAIEGCGVNVPDTKLISDYAQYIRQIPSAVFSDLDVGPFGGEDMYIKTIEQKDGLITATTGGLVSSASSGLVPKVINTNTATIESAYYVLASANGSASPSWYKLPTNVFKNDNTTYTFTSGTAGNFTVTPSGGTAQTVNIGKPSTAGYADTAGSVAWENVSGRPTSLPANGGNADTVDGYHASSFMHFQHDGGNYINASFLDNTLSTLANTYYIEFWDSAGGWFNSAWGKVLATTGFVKSGSSDSYVLLGGGGHKAESSLSVNYASSAGNADTLNGYHANSAGNKPWGTIPVVNTSGWMEIGKHLEFHFDNTTGSDFSTALMCTGNHSNVVNLPSASGTLALTSQIPTSLPANGGTANYINYTSRASKGNGYAQFCQYSGASNNPHDDWYSHIIMNHPNSAGYYTEIAACFHSDSVYFRKQSNGSTTDWKKFAWTSDIPTVSNSNGYVPRFVSFPDYMHFGSSTDTYDYLKNIVKWVYDNANYGNKTYLMGVGHPNNLGMMNIQLYGTDGKNSEGYPKYCSGTFLNLGDSAFEIFGTVDYNYYRYRLSVDGHGHRITKLHRRDASDDYSLQHHWTGSYWYLRGYYGDNYHAGVQVDYANSAGSAGTASKVTCTEAFGDTPRPIVGIVNNQLYYTNKVNIRWDNGNVTAPTFTGRLIGSADQVDGYHISVVNSLPSPKDNNTIYILV